MRLYQQKYIKKSEAAKGFTLVELLVVISIIALLLAILMPSLQRARDQAKNIVCLSNQKQISLAFVVYATENDDSLPVHYDGNKITQQNASMTYYIKALGEWTGFGRLYKTKVFSDAKAFYCPSQPKDSCFSYKNGWEIENKEFPWNMVFGGNQISSYMYRVFTQCNDTQFQTGAYVDYLRKLKYSQIRGNMALTSDVFYKNYGYSYAPSVRTWAHSTNSCGVNASYSDGSAKWVTVGKERYENSNDWIKDGRMVDADDYATVFFKCLDKENFRDLDEAYDIVF